MKFFSQNNQAQDRESLLFIVLLFLVQLSTACAHLLPWLHSAWQRPSLPCLITNVRRHLLPLFLTGVCHPWTFSADMGSVLPFYSCPLLDLPPFCLSFVESSFCMLSFIGTADSSTPKLKSHLILNKGTKGELKSPS